MAYLIHKFYLRLLILDEEDGFLLMRPDKMIISQVLSFIKLLLISLEKRNHM